MSYSRNYRSQGGTVHVDRWSSFDRNSFNYRNRSTNMNVNGSNGHNSSSHWNYNHFRDFLGKYKDYNNSYDYNSNYVNPPPPPPPGPPSFKRRKFSTSTWGDGGRHYPQMNTCEITDGGRRYVQMNAYERSDSGRHYPQMNAYETSGAVAYYSAPLPARSNAEVSTSTSCKRDRSKLEEDEPIFMSRDEIERYSPSRKDGIDAIRETHLRYSYCAFLQNLGLQLDLPQTTIGTAMVLCHRFFVRRSHASNDRFLIATAALFLAAKSEETPRPLSNVLRASCEIYHKQDITFLSYLLPVDWFEEYRERVLEAEQMILTTLNFELNVQHPYDPLTSVFNKLGLSHSVLVNLALNLVSEGVYKISVLTCMILLAGRLICCAWKLHLLPARGIWVDGICHGDSMCTSWGINTLLRSPSDQTVDTMMPDICSEKLRSSLWLQFKPQHIAAGAAYLAAKFLNLDVASYQNIWMEFQTSPAILHDVTQQLMELF